MICLYIQSIRLNRFQSFANAFGRMSRFSILALSTLQHMSVSALEDDFSEDASGDYEVCSEMQENDEHEEEHLQIAQAHFETCDTLETLWLIRFSDPLRMAM